MSRIPSARRSAGLFLNIRFPEKEKMTSFEVDIAVRTVLYFPNNLRGKQDGASRGEKSIVYSSFPGSQPEKDRYKTK